VRRCIIHIGHSKTASTYLQHCLHLNAGLFARHNYWLPADFCSFGFYDLATLSAQGAVISGNLAPLHELMCSGPGDLIPPMYDYLFDAPDMPDDCDVLLSSELFFYYMWALVRLVRTARKYGFAPELVAFLPRQDRAAVTGYLQNVRYHGFNQGVVEFLVHDSNMPYCRYSEALQRVLDIVPDLPITLRTFDRAFMRDGDVLTEFLTAIDCRVSAGECVRPVQASNEGLLLEHYELLRAATILGRADAAEQLRTAEVALTPQDRARITAYYYRPGVQAFLTQYHLPGNLALLERMMPLASDDERSYWRGFDAVPDPVSLDPNLFERLRAGAFG
jgi:hypothetical protein